MNALPRLLGLLALVAVLTAGQAHAQDDSGDILDRLREDSHLKTIPVIVMSGKDPTRDEQAFLRDRVSAVLKKGSHSAGDLLASIKARLRPASAEREER